MSIKPIFFLLGAAISGLSWSLSLPLNTLREVIFSGRKFHENEFFFDPPPENVVSRKLIPTKLFKISDSRKLIPVEFFKNQ